MPPLVESRLKMPHSRRSERGALAAARSRGSRSHQRSSSTSTSRGWSGRRSSRRTMSSVSRTGSEAGMPSSRATAAPLSRRRPERRSCASRAIGATAGGRSLTTPKRLACRGARGLVVGLLDRPRRAHQAAQVPEMVEAQQDLGQDAVEARRLATQLDDGDRDIGDGGLDRGELEGRGPLGRRARAPPPGRRWRVRVAGRRRPSHPDRAPSRSGRRHRDACRPRPRR